MHGHTVASLPHGANFPAQPSYRVAAASLDSEPRTDLQLSFRIPGDPPCPGTGTPSRPAGSPSKGDWPPRTGSSEILRLPAKLFPRATGYSLCLSSPSLLFPPPGRTGHAGNARQTWSQGTSLATHALGRATGPLPQHPPRCMDLVLSVPCWGVGSDPLPLLPNCPSMPFYARGPLRGGSPISVLMQPPEPVVLSTGRKDSSQMT